MSSTPAKIRNACFTLNNYTDTDIDNLRTLGVECKYLIAAREVGASGTPHLQGYLELETQMRFNALKDKIPRAHLEARKGTAKQADDYCRKGEQSHEEWAAEGTAGPNYGVNVDIAVVLGALGTQKPGRRTDLLEVVESVLEGANLRQLAENHPEQYIKFNKGIQDYRAKMTAPRSADTPKEIIVHYGPTGTNKTRTAVEAHPEAYLIGPEQGKWHDGYDQHTEVILEEFRAQFTFGYLLRYLDRYPMQVEYKGGLTPFKADTIIITAPNHPALWYKPESTKDGKIDQLKRRINKILKFTDKNLPPTDVTNDEWPTPPDPPPMAVFEQFA